MTEIGLVLTTFNRPRYLARTLEGLRQSDLPGTTLVIVDDGSASESTLGLVRGFEAPGVVVRRIFRPRKRPNPLRRMPLVRRLVDSNRDFTVHEALRAGWDDLLAHGPDTRILANLDADVLVRSDWLRRLRALFERERLRRDGLIVTGFHAPRHHVLETHADFLVKETVGGINLLFGAGLYRDLIRPSLVPYWDDEVCRRARCRGVQLLCSRPSVVQHIGVQGWFSTPREHDVAPDFTPRARSEARSDGSGLSA